LILNKNKFAAFPEKTETVYPGTFMEIIKHTLDNGLRLVINPDYSSPLVALNLVYDVGSKDEDPKLTGFAHLFEHLMFGGTVNIPDFDIPLQRAGGENNAFTNNDLTNFYINIPAHNIETAFWLESDRMLGLDFSETSLEIQKKVVIEEFKQRYLNQPYGDVWLNLRPLAYKIHPYRWATIGKETAHIEKADIDNVRDFFYSHYAPNNAILSLSGRISPEKSVQLAEKWFGSIPRRKIQERNLPAEPVQKEEMRLELDRDVPADCIYLAFHMPGRLSTDFHIADLISDILGSGNSSRLNQILVKEKKLFSSIDSYITADIEPGLFIVTGKTLPSADIRNAEKEIWKILQSILEEEVGQREFDKVKNKFEANFYYGQTSVLNKAVNLGFYELLGDSRMIVSEVEKYRRTDPGALMRLARDIFRKENSSTLIYHAQKS
jgi:predicted Zn-dependent peptidase